MNTIRNNAIKYQKEIEIAFDEIKLELTLLSKSYNLILTHFIDAVKNNPEKFDQEIHNLLVDYEDYSIELDML